MSERQDLQKRRRVLLEQIARAADEIRKIDERLAILLAGRRRPGAGAA